MSAAELERHSALSDTDATEALDLISTSARLLFTNGQTTEKIVNAFKRLANGLGYRAEIFPGWGKLTLRLESDGGWHESVLNAAPVAVDIRKVIAAMGVIDQIVAGSPGGASARSAFEAIDRLPPVPMIRFAAMAGSGAAALGVIFGAVYPLSLLVIAFSAALGACLRRWLAQRSQNLFVQPLCAALLAGFIGSVALRLQMGSTLQLVAVCPCMVLVPGPHFLNGALDLARARIPLGLSRLAYALLFTLMICTGLVLGLALGGSSLPASGSFNPVPIALDILAAGVAVAAYGSFFNMPWRMLPIPILVGMLAHACRWVVISVTGATAEAGALIACLVVGLIMTPIANHLRLPFAGVAFASVVSLIPGVYLFRLAGGMVELAAPGLSAPQELVSQMAFDGTTAILIILAMAFGLIVPKLCIEHFTGPADK
jgi:uncharacterized membrane protein YjjP (DUF1212 family)